MKFFWEFHGSSYFLPRLDLANGREYIWNCSRYLVSCSLVVAAIHNMNIGVCKISLRLPENLSLKGKRQVLRSVTTRIRNKFNVSVAEVDDQDLWQLATLGICCVSNDKRYTNEVLSKVVNFVVDSRFELEILDYEIEILPVL